MYLLANANGYSLNTGCRSSDAKDADNHWKSSQEIHLFLFREANYELAETASLSNYLFDEVFRAQAFISDMPLCYA